MPRRLESKSRARPAVFRTRRDPSPRLILPQTAATGLDHRSKSKLSRPPTSSRACDYMSRRRLAEPGPVFLLMFAPTVQHRLGKYLSFLSGTSEFQMQRSAQTGSSGTLI